MQNRVWQESSVVLVCNNLKDLCRWIYLFLAILQYRATISISQNLGLTIGIELTLEIHSIQRTTLEDNMQGLSTEDVGTSESHVPCLVSVCVYDGQSLYSIESPLDIVALLGCALVLNILLIIGNIRSLD